MSIGNVYQDGIEKVQNLFFLFGFIQEKMTALEGTERTGAGAPGMMSPTMDLIKGEVFIPAGKHIDITIQGLDLTGVAVIPG